MIGGFLTCSTKPHDVAFIRQPVKGRFHHASFVLDNWGDVLRAADIIATKNVSLDIGPTRHGITPGERRSISSTRQATEMRCSRAGISTIQISRFLLGPMMDSERRSSITIASSTRNFCPCSLDRGLGCLVGSSSREYEWSVVGEDADDRGVASGCLRNPGSP